MSFFQFVSVYNSLSGQHECLITCNICGPSNFYVFPIYYLHILKFYKSMDENQSVVLVDLISLHLHFGTLDVILTFILSTAVIKKKSTIFFFFYSFK